MRKSERPFFATPDEQRLWLRNLLADKSIWCVLRVFPPNWKIEVVTDTEFLEELQLKKDGDIGGFDLYLGRSDLISAPVWRSTGDGRRDIDLTRSQAIAYDPSMVADGDILLEGQMAIMRGTHYEEAGIDPKPLRKWFGEMTKSFGELSAGGVVVCRDPNSGKEKEYPDIIATQGAVQWQRSGRLLKQFVRGAYEFDIRTV